MITIDRGTNLFISNWHTLPMYLTVYPDGVAIRADGVGMHAEPLPRMTIGRIDDCALEQVVAELIDLAEQDMGDPRISDQSTTRIVLRLPGGTTSLTVSAYALGVGDKYVEPAQAAARARLSAVIDGLAAGMSGERAWTPDRLRLTWFDTNEPGPGSRPIAWPLDEPIAAVFDGDAGDRYPCTVVGGARAAAMLDALGTQPTVSPWSDGSRIASIAVGVLVPGQEGCRER